MDETEQRGVEFHNPFLALSQRGLIAIATVLELAPIGSPRAADVVPMHRMRRAGQVALLLVVRSEKLDSAALRCCFALDAAMRRGQRVRAGRLCPGALQDTLHRSVARLEHLRPLPLGNRLRRAARAPPGVAAAAAGGGQGLISDVGPALDPVFFLEAALGLAEPVGPVARDRPRLLGALVVEALGLAQPAAPALRGRQLGR